MAQPNYATGGSSANIYNTSTGQLGYNTPGAANQAGWAALPSNGQTGTIPDKTSSATPANYNTTSTSSQAPVAVYSPAIITSNAAQDNLSNITTKYSDINTNVTNQAANNKIIADNAKLQAGVAADNAAKAKIEQDKVNIAQQAANAKTAAVAGGATPVPTATGGATPAPAPTGGTPATPAPAKVGDLTAENANYANTLNTTLNNLSNAYDTYKNQVLQMQNGTFPLSGAQKALVDSTAQAFEDSKQAANLRGAALSSETGGFSNKVSQAIGEVSNIDSQKAAAIARLEMGFQDQNYKMITDSYKAYTDAESTKTTILSALHNDAVTQANLLRKENQDAQDKIDKKNQDAQDKVDQISLEAAKNGATKETLDAIKASGMDLNTAISAAGMYLQTASGDLGNYLQYKKDTVQKGLTPLDYQSWTEKEQARASKLKSSEAYSSAYNSAAGKAAAEAKYGTGDSSNVGTDPVAGATGLTQATGLSIQAFNFLTQGTASMSRMPISQRNAIMKEANNYLNKTGTDIATFQAQYKALSSTVTANLMRNNQAQVAESELSATIDNLTGAVDSAGLGSINKLNVAKIWAGKQLNTPEASTYKMHLEQLRNEFAMYNAAISGQIDANGNIRQITEADTKKADEIIQNGFASGSIEGFSKALNSSITKMGVVLDSSVNAQNKQVWKLFGVEDKYQAPTKTVDPKTAVDDYVKANPSQTETVAKLFDVPGVTDQDVADYLNLFKQK